MSRAKTNKLYRTFVKGLITEASYLTYPEDASIDEQNTVLSRKGNRTRRLGINYEDDYQINNFLYTSVNQATNEFVWKAINNDPQANFLVVQTGPMIRFFILDANPISDGLKSFSVDLREHLRETSSAASIGKTHVEFTSGKGYLFVCSADIKPLLIEYLPTTDAIAVQEITIMIRDFDGLNDGLANDQEPTTLSREHHYNLMNQGWVQENSSTSSTASTALNNYAYVQSVFGVGMFGIGGITYGSYTSGPIYQYFGKMGRYPGNNKQWWVAKAQADDDKKGIKLGDFLPELLSKTYYGNTKAPNGHFILDAFRRDRTSVSGISDIVIERKASYPKAIAFFSGRVWYGAGSDVYYSQVIDNKNRVGMCYQEADPTSETISDLIETDGGVIPIPEASFITRLIPLSNGVLVFSLTGVWYISGGSNGFSATDISVDKVSSLGTKSPLSIVTVDDTVFWWSEVGINALQQSMGQFGPVPGKFGNPNIAEQTIQSFYNDIPEDAKSYVKGCYDPKNNVIHWLWRDADDPNITYNYTYNNVLIFDITLQAFYPWHIGSGESSPMLSGIFMETSLLSQETSDTVTASGDIVLTSTGIEVTSLSYGTVVRPTNLTYTTLVNLQGLTFSKFNSLEYVDWEAYDGIGITYESYIETGYELLEDAMRKKQAIYIFSYFRRTEDDPSSPPSTCTFRAKWDWTSSSSSNKWTNPIEAYRPRLFTKETTADTTSGMPVVVSKNKVRGGGKAVQFRFGTAERGKTFDLLGWSVPFVGNTDP